MIKCACGEVYCADCWTSWQRPCNRRGEICCGTCFDTIQVPEFPPASTRREVKTTLLALEMEKTTTFFDAVKRELHDVLSTLRTSRVFLLFDGTVEKMPDWDHEERGAVRIDSREALNGLVVVNCNEYIGDDLTEVQEQCIWQWATVELTKSLVDCGYDVVTEKHALSIRFSV